MYHFHLLHAKNIPNWVDVHHNQTIRSSSEDLLGHPSAIPISKLILFLMIVIIAIIGTCEEAGQFHIIIFFGVIGLWPIDSTRSASDFE